MSFAANAIEGRVQKLDKEGDGIIDTSQAQADKKQESDEAIKYGGIKAALGDEDRYTGKMEGAEQDNLDPSLRGQGGAAQTNRIGATGTDTVVRGSRQDPNVDDSSATPWERENLPLRNMTAPRGPAVAHMAIPDINAAIEEKPDGFVLDNSMRIYFERDRAPLGMAA